MLLEDAWALAQQILDRDVRPIHAVDIVIAKVLDHERAWVFSYNTRPFLEKNDFLAGLVGNGPIVIPKSGEPPFYASSARPVADQL